MKHGSNFKMSLVGERLDFEWDPLFRKEVLRQVDNEYLFGKKRDLESKKEHDAKYKDPTKFDPEDHKLEDFAKGPNSDVKEEFDEDSDTFDENRVEELDYNLELRIMRRIMVKEARENDPNKDKYVFKQYKDANPIRDWEDYRMGLIKQKERLDTKSFDELAEKELFGRVLPKDESIERIIA